LVTAYKVYFDPSVINNAKHECCETPDQKDAHQRRLSTNRAIVWLSLGVAVAGASYGRVSLPKQFAIESKLQSSSAKSIESFTANAVKVGIVRLQIRNALWRMRQQSSKGNSRH
jgi:hypothetical protein